MIKLKSLIIEVSHSLTKDKLQQVKNIPTRLYHATFSSVVNNIVKYGLIPGRSSGTNFHETDRRFVYLASSSNGAKNIIEDLISSDIRIRGKYGDEINVLTIDGSKLDRKKLFHDPYSGIVGTESFMYANIIAPNLILDYGDS